MCYNKACTIRLLLRSGEGDNVIILINKKKYTKQIMSSWYSHKYGLRHFLQMKSPYVKPRRYDMIYSTIPSTIPYNAPSSVPSTILSDVPSTVPSDVSSDVPSTIPSDVSSDIPSTVPSDVPSTVPSDVPSTVPSDTVSDVSNTIALNNSISKIEFTAFELNTIYYCLNKYELTKFSELAKYAAIMLESRYTDNLDMLLKQISRFISSDWCVILYVTKNVYDRYVELVKNSNDTIQVKLLEYTLNSVSDYNNIILNSTFWEELKSFKKILIFQNDTLMYKYGIENFLEYDYIGAPWPKELGTITCVGNGGFSLRDTIATINCINNIDNIIINDYKQYDINIKRLGRQPEDIFFSYGMVQLGYKLPTRDLAKHFSIETVDFNLNVIGSHRLDFFNKSCYNTNLLNSIVPYHMKSFPDSNDHRFGWQFVTCNLRNIFINTNGILFHTWLDCDYLFNSNEIIPNNTFWVGITHLTPCVFKKYFNICNIDNLQHNRRFIKDLKYCKGIFTLSIYMKKYFKQMLMLIGYPDIPVSSIYHPICITEPFFNQSSIDNINTVISIGSQLRRNITIFKLNTTLHKIWLPGRTTDKALELLESECKEFNIKLTTDEIKSVDILYLNNSQYDEIQRNSFIIIDMYNASANNALIECISRNIPCFVINLPAVVEYIGEDYPLIFNNTSELEEKLNNKELILSAYKYLVNRPYLKERLTIDHFIRDILNSEVTKNVLTITL